jgi:ABC-type bacteriocin/lantibiotic exporter with double-glycine peptidase domain
MLEDHTIAIVIFLLLLIIGFTSFFCYFLREQNLILLPLTFSPCSQTMMSQFMNGATRVKGWTATNALLDSWADKFNAQLKVQTDLIEQQKNQKKDAESTNAILVSQYTLSRV